MELEALLQNLNQIDQLLTNDQYQVFLQNYGIWETQRYKSISTLKKLREELENFKSITDIGQTISTGMISAGLLGTAYGLYKNLSGDETDNRTGNIIMKGGLLVAGAGCAGVACCGALEHVNNVIVDNKVKETLDEDLVMSNSLLPFLKRSEQLDHLWKETFRCSITSNTFQCFLSTISKIQTLCNGGQITYGDIANRLTSTDDFSQAVDSSNNDSMEIFNFLSDISLDVKQILLEYCNNPLIREIVSKIYQSCTEASFKFVISSFNVIQDLRIIVANRSTAVSTLSSAMPILDTLHDTLSPELQILFHTITTAIKIVTDIKLTVDNIDKETMRYSKELKRIIYLLTLELDSLKLVYKTDKDDQLKLNENAGN